MKKKLLLLFVPVLLGVMLLTLRLGNVSASPAQVYSTATRTRTATKTAVGAPTATRTPTPTITSTPVAGAVCSPLTATVTAPFVFDGVGEYCWRISSLGSISSFSVDTLTVNGVNEATLWLTAAQLPPQIGGYWYVHFVVKSHPWAGHFEAQP